MGCDEGLYYPIMIQLDKMKICLFGGGKIAYRKASSIIECGGKISVVSTDFIEEFNELVKINPKLITLIQGEYHPKYLDTPQLVVAATNSADTNMKIYEDCLKRGLLCNVVDNGKESDYIFPAVVRRGDLILSVSTSGESPELSKKIKGEIAEKYDCNYEEYVNLLGTLREKVLRSQLSKEEKHRILNEQANMELEELKKYSSGRLY